MIRTIVDVTLVYSDSTTFYVGQFSSTDAANAWIATEKTRPYWDQATTVTINIQTITEGT